MEGGNDRSEVGTTKDCLHYNDSNEVPWDILNYYHQRFSIFSKYDEGIWMTENAWYGVTPEPVANKIAEHVVTASPAEKNVLIDCFAGVGGNTIAFAKSGRWKRVYAIEKDAQVLACAKHNAEIYGVQDKISWYEGDCFQVLRKELVDLVEHSVVFGSPPWGGPGYRSDPVFNLNKMQPYAIHDLVPPLFRASDFVLYLPRNSDLRQLAHQIKNDEKMTVVHYCMEGASKAICAYFGNFDFVKL